MENLLIISAGCLGMTIAIAHGYLGETKVVQAAQELTASQLRILQAVMFLTATYWFVGGVVLVAGAVLLTEDQLFLAATIVGAMFLSGAIGNAWATRGRHFGWVLLLCAVALAWSGAWAVVSNGT